MAPSQPGWSDPAPSAADRGREPPPGRPDAAPRYERLDLVGQGGLGRVYEAWDRVLQRRVALKEVTPALAGTALADRLAREARLTAGLEHPGIVSVHDCGRTDDGRPFYTMRLVEGRSLAELLAAPGAADRRPALLRSVLDACLAVGFAHRSGVLHCDLKPENIVTGELGETQVVDWGLARRLDGDRAPAPPGGTAGYASPEARARTQVDARADVWSLGVTLGAVLDAVDDGSGRDAPLRSVVRRATAPRPDGRYPDAVALARELERHLDGRPVHAHRYSPRERVLRFVARWRAALLVAAVAATALAVLGGAAAWRTAAARDEARAAEARTREALVRSDAHLARALEAQALTALRSGHLPRAEVLAAHALELAESPLARGVFLAGGRARRPEAVARAPLPACDRLVLGPDHALCLQPAGLELHPLTADGVARSIPGVYTDAAVVAGRLVLLTPDRGLRIEDLATGTVQVRHDDLPGGAALAVDEALGRIGVLGGGRLAWIDVASGERREGSICGPEGGAAVLAASGGRWAATCRLQGMVVHAGETRELPLTADWEPRVLAWDDGVLLAATVGGHVLRYRPDSGELERFPDVLDGPVDHLVPLGAGRRLAVARTGGGTRVVSLDGADAALHLPGAARDLGRTADGQLLIAGAELRRWTLPSLAAASRLAAPAGISAVSLSPDGRTVAAARGDGAVSVWAWRGGRLLTELQWQRRVAKWVDFSPDGARLVAAGLGEGGARTWHTGDWSPDAVLPSSPLRRVGFLSDGRLWGLPYGPGAYLDLADPAGRAVSTETAVDAARPPSGDRVVLLYDSGAVRLLAAGAPRPVPLLDGSGARGIAVDEAGRVALAYAEHVALFDLDGRPDGRLASPVPELTDLARSPDGRLVAAGARDGRLVLWDTAQPRPRAVVQAHGDRISAVTFDPTGRWLVTGSWTGAVRRWSLDDLRTPAPALVAATTAAWDLDLDAALGAVAAGG